MNGRTEPDLPDDWDESRLADAYRALADRAQPNGLSAGTIVARATEGRPPRTVARWSTLRRWVGVGLVAAAVVVAVVVVAPRAIVTAPASPETNPNGPPVATAAVTPTAGEASASASAPSTASPSSTPTARVPVLDAAALADIVSRERAGGLAPTWVATSARMGVAAGIPGMPSVVECWPTGTCRMIGSISGAGIVAIREEDRVVEPPLPTGDAPIVLRIAQAGPLEYLGQLDIASAAAPLAAPALAARTDAAKPGTVLAVRAWMNAGHEVFSAGPRPPGDEPLPFVGQDNGAWLADHPFLPLIRVVDPNGSQITGGRETGDARVQAGAYSQFAPDPADADEVNYAPREGLWLVRAVSYEPAGQAQMRGWLLVGRIDAAPREATPSGMDVPGYPRVMSAQEAAQAVAFLDREGKVILVDGSIEATFGPACLEDLCPAGLLRGTKVGVWTSRETRSFARPTYGGEGVSAYRVRKDGLEFLGWMGYAADGTFTDSLADLDALANPPTPDAPSGPSGPVTFVVRGWLVDQGVPIPCPTMPDDGWPFGCGESWITPAEYQPVAGTDWNAVTPTTGIEVQADAYRAIAPDPAWLPSGIAHAPREGTWLVRLLTGRAGQRAWELVGRLAP